MLTMFSGGGSYFKGLDNKIIGFVRIQLFLTTLLQFEIHVGLEIFKLQIYQLKKTTHHPAVQSRRCSRNDEQSILLPLPETELRDSNNISIDH